MGKFKYKLQNLLNVKGKLEEVKKGEYGKALAYVKELENDKNLIIDKIKNTRNNLKENSKGALSIEILKGFKGYIHSLEKKEKELEKSIKIANENADIKKEELIKAMQERKTLEKLKETELLKFKKKELMQEQSLVDEIVSYNHNKKVNR